MKNSKKKQLGFTLLEVLMVVAMLAIVGGAIITSYGGLDRKAATSTGVHSLSALDNAFNVFAATEGGLPNNLDTLIAATPAGAAFVAAEADNSATGASGGVLAAILSHSLEDKLTVTSIDPEPLLDAGITRIRYMDLKGNGAGATLDIKGADGAATEVDNIVDIDIPSRAFEVPQIADGNRGRGYYVNLVAEANVPMAVWNAGVNGINNVMVGGEPSSVLVAFGISNSSSLIGDGIFTNLSAAPFHGGTAKNEYNLYIALVDVSVEPARIVSIVCPNGHFADAEFAESRGQGGGDHDH
jgi:prepilin-type N-terminal cleavage/methylation domain-containing protein